MARKELVEKICKLLEKILEKKPEYKKDVLSLQLLVFSSDYASATDYFVELFKQFATDPDLQEYRPEIANIFLEIVLEANCDE